MNSTALAQHPNQARKSQTFCGAYAFRGPIRIIGEQTPQLYSAYI